MRTHKQTTVRPCGALLVSFCFDDSKTRRAWDRCPQQTVKENLSAYFGVFGIFEGVLLHAQMTPRPVQHGGGVELDPVLQSTLKRRQCFA